MELKLAFKAAIEERERELSSKVKVVLSFLEREK